MRDAVSVTHGDRAVDTPGQMDTRYLWRGTKTQRAGQEGAVDLRGTTELPCGDLVHGGGGQRGPVDANTTERTVTSQSLARRPR